MKPAVVAFALVLCWTAPAAAHVAFSSVELHVTGRSVEVTIVAQAYDLAHDLGIDPPEKLVNLEFLVSQKDALAKLADTALTIAADDVTLTPASWGVPAAAPDQQLVRLRARYETAGMPGRLTITSRLFSYDTAHQTLLTVYSGDALETQQMLDAARPSFVYFTNSRAGVWSVVRRFTRAGMQSTLTGYDHLLFVIALLLLGGEPRRLAAIVGAFTLSYSVALALSGAGLVSVPLAIVAPGVALSVVYSGVDNLMIRGGRDLRAWVALAFGWLHGLSFASALGAMDRPIHKPAWALVSFNLGIEVAVLLAAVGLLSLTSLAASSAAKPRVATAMSAAVAALGAVSFIRSIVLR